MLTSLLGVLLMIVGFGVLIFVHELGHFIAAKWAGIRTEAFAVGMGPVVASWRMGIGAVVGSTERKVVARTGKRAAELTDEELIRHGIGETEYSLRWLPIGGFVKMLGQEDANPNAVSDDPRSYNMRPIGKRMVVVSAGVIMNVILAIALFMTAFMVGVRFEAPVIGYVPPTTPAGLTMPANAASLGITEPGLRPGDRVRAIDGDPARTFADLQIATAMARPGRSITVEVDRRGIPEPVRFELLPVVGAETGLLSIGVTPGRSNRLYEQGFDEIRGYLVDAGIGGVGPGLRLVEADGFPIETFDELGPVVDASNGTPVRTVWRSDEEADQPVTVVENLRVEPAYEELWYPGPQGPTPDEGLLGLSPRVRIQQVLPGSPNEDVLRAGDVILRAGGIDFPRRSQFKNVVQTQPGVDLPLVVARDGVRRDVTVEVNRSGAIGVMLAHDETPATAEPLADVLGGPSSDGELIPTAIAGLDLLGGTRIDAVGGQAIASWPELRAALRTQTEAALNAGTGVTLPLAVTHPTPGTPAGTVPLTLTADQVASLHALGWRSGLDGAFFQPVHTTLSAGGNPITAIQMGFGETHKMIVMTYLTIDRLFRGSVGVKQLRGPVGIIDLGAKILPRGFMWFIFFLGMISVNLAVLNFLPIPIVDGGLFLFLIYEKIKGQPPSLRFQNAATIVGLCLIGTVFIVTFYNDIMRLL
ncbi:MAG: hypothetical protein HKN62_00745 [Phycisphaerales bacterium]|nr:hypothetical protein [Phycisphaerales bacterium]